MATTPAPVLTFSTLHEGLPVVVDGATYSIRHFHALSIGTLKRIERLAPQVGQMLQRDVLSPAEDAQLSGLLADLCATVLDAPPAVQATLADQQRVDIVMAFVQLRQTTTPATVGAHAADLMSLANGKSPSPDSPASTVADPMTGTGASPLVS